jgi:hypothetical protein
MKFTTKTRSVPVEVEVDGVLTEYKLVEMTAATRDKYMDSVTGRMRLDAGGKPLGVVRFDGMQADLLVHTLQTKEGKAISKETIQAWPASTVSGLFAESQKLNLLSGDEKDVVEETKNV